MSVSLKRLEEQEDRIESLKRSLKTTREKFTGFPAQVQSAMVTGAAGYGLGAVESYFRKQGQTMPSATGSDWEITWALAGLAASHFVGGKMGEIGVDVAKASLAIAGYKRGVAQR